MTPEEKALLENTHTLVKENNELLQSLLRRAKITNAAKIIYWVIIVGLSLGAFYFIPSFLSGITGGDLSSTSALFQQLQGTEK